MGLTANKNCCWVQLIDQDELVVLIQAMRDYGFDGIIVSVEWKELSSLGKRMKVTIQQPGTTKSKQVTYLTGDNYKKWNLIKKTIYTLRKSKRFK